MNKISFIVPIRNEKQNIEITKESYMNILKKGHQLILVDDHSNDGSSELVKKLYSQTEADIVYLTENSSNIIGKNRALIEGYKYVKYDELCFMDADIYNINVEEIERLVLKKNEKEVYTTVPKFINKNFIENFSLFFQQVLYMNFHLLKSDSEVFGGFYIISKKLYEEIGTHYVVQEKIVEDLEIGKKIKEKGRVIVFRSNFMLINMYSTYEELYQGWKKNISYSLFNIKFKNSLILFSYIFLLVIFLFTIPKVPYQYILDYVVITLFFMLTKKFYLQTKAVYLVFWPLYLMNFIFIFFISLISKKSVWKGRTYKCRTN